MIYHVGQYSRQLNLLPYVTDVGYLPNKTESVKKVFKSCNISFVVKGNGWYMYKGEKINVVAPAILLQWPGEEMYYGPDRMWDEYFFIYSDKSFIKLKQSGAFNIDRPVYPLVGFVKCNELLSKIIQLTFSKNLHFPIDRLDMLCWQAISETKIVDNSSFVLSDKERIIHSVATKIKSDPLASYDFNLISTESGMSLPSFRRYWQKFIGVSPRRFIADIKLSIACKLLVESDKNIGEISHFIKIEDSLYFSRFFKKKTGLTPREYRYNHKVIILD